MRPSPGRGLKILLRSLSAIVLLLLVVGLAARVTPVKPRLSIHAGKGCRIAAFSPDSNTFATNEELDPFTRGGPIRLWEIRRVAYCGRSSQDGETSVPSRSLPTVAGWLLLTKKADSKSGI
jgi:hypothetical protein